MNREDDDTGENENENVHVEQGCEKEDLANCAPLEVFETTVLDSVKHMIEELVEVPSRLKFYYTVTSNPSRRPANKATLTIHIPEEEMGKVYGKQMRVYSAIKTIAFSIASKNGFYLVMQIHQIYPKKSKSQQSYPRRRERRVNAGIDRSTTTVDRPE